MVLTLEEMGPPYGGEQQNGGIQARGRLHAGVRERGSGGIRESSPGKLQFPKIQPQTDRGEHLARAPLDWILLNDKSPLPGAALDSRQKASPFVLVPVVQGRM
jgi:hypothetical protein